MYTTVIDSYLKQKTNQRNVPFNIIVSFSHDNNLNILLALCVRQSRVTFVDSNRGAESFYVMFLCFVQYCR